MIRLPIFCGLGNFTLAIARQAGSVIGYEGSPTLVKRAQNNADLHGLSSCASFHEANLFAVTQEWLMAQDRWDQVLLDPPREGALALARRSLVYISHSVLSPCPIGWSMSLVILQRWPAMRRFWFMRVAGGYHRLA